MTAALTALVVVSACSGDDGGGDDGAPASPAALDAVQSAALALLPSGDEVERLAPRVSVTSEGLEDRLPPTSFCTALGDLDDVVSATTTTTGVVRTYLTTGEPSLQTAAFRVDDVLDRGAAIVRVARGAVASCAASTPSANPVVVGDNRTVVTFTPTTDPVGYSQTATTTDTVRKAVRQPVTVERAYAYADGWLLEVRTSYSGERTLDVGRVLAAMVSRAGSAQPTSATPGG